MERVKQLLQTLVEERKKMRLGWKKQDIENRARYRENQRDILVGKGRERERERIGKYFSGSFFFIKRIRESMYREREMAFERKKEKEIQQEIQRETET